MAIISSVLELLTSGMVDGTVLGGGKGVGRTASWAVGITVKGDTNDCSVLSLDRSFPFPLPLFRFFADAFLALEDDLGVLGVSSQSSQVCQLHSLR